MESLITLLFRKIVLDVELSRINRHGSHFEGENKETEVMLVKRSLPRGIHLDNEVFPLFHQMCFQTLSDWQVAEKAISN